MLGCFVGHVSACPRFAEFFPDPVDVSDQEGEFVEIRLEHGGESSLETMPAESLWVHFEEKSPLRFSYLRLRGMNRLLLVHDNAGCAKSAPGETLEGVACESLGSLSLPNARESVWRLSAGNCLDSVVLPAPKAGKSLQRVKDTDRWSVADPTPGLANPYYELGIADCGIALSASGREIQLSGCDSSMLVVELIEVFSGFRRQDSVVVRGNYPLDRLLESGKVYWLRARLPRDEAPANDILDTLIVVDRAAESLFPLQISEIHHCPAEPEPEWVEVYNAAAFSLPLSKFRFCGRGGAWAVPSGGVDSIASHESVVFTRDTLLLREFMGFRDVRLRQVSLGYLNNAAGAVAICMGDDVVDSVAWDKTTVACPAGFDPRTGRSENTPGFQGRHVHSGFVGEAPFTYKISSRVVRRSGAPLRVLVESESPVGVRLLDSAGREVYRRTVPAQSSAWWEIPLTALPHVGIAYVELSVGRYEKMLGILLRP